MFYNKYRVRTVLSHIRRLHIPKFKAPIKIPRVLYVYLLHLFALFSTCIKQNVIRS